MKILTPVYYKKFKCTASKCKDSCCVGWNVTIDKDSFNKYRKVTGDIGKTLTKNISRERKTPSDTNYGKMKLDENKRCGLLEDSGLCNVHKELGEEYLCITCKSYPRKTNKINMVIERNLTISCPEVARLLVENNNPLSFDFYEDNLMRWEEKVINKKQIKQEVYDTLWECRSFCIELMQFREINFWKRMSFLIMFLEKIQKYIDNKEYSSVNDVICEVRGKVTSMDMINALDEVKRIDEVKMVLTNSILNSRVKSGVSNNTFREIIKRFSSRLSQKENFEIIECLKVLDEKFEVESEEIEDILENYAVYNIFGDFNYDFANNNIEKFFVKLSINLSIIKLLLMSEKEFYGERFDLDNIVDVLYSFSRVIEHNTSFINNIYNEIDKLKYDKVAYSMILIR